MFLIGAITAGMEVGAAIGTAIATITGGSMVVSSAVRTVAGAGVGAVAVSPSMRWVESCCLKITTEGVR